MSISSSPSPQSAKLCPMSVHPSVQELEFISRLMQISYARNITWRDVGLCPSNAHLQLWYPSAPLHHLYLLSFNCPMSVHRCVQELEFYSVVNRLKPLTYTIGIFGRAVVSCPPNAHLQVWCLSATLHQICVLNFVQCVCIDPFKI